MQFHDPNNERLQTGFLYLTLVLSVDCTNAVKMDPIS